MSDLNVDDRDVAEQDVDEHLDVRGHYLGGQDVGEEDSRARNAGDQDLGDKDLAGQHLGDQDLGNESFRVQCESSESEPGGTDNSDDTENRQDPDTPSAPDQTDPDAGKIATMNKDLRLLPENARYFAYKGLPLVSFGHQAGLSPVPVADFSAQSIIDASRYGNSVYTAIHPEWVSASHEELLERLRDDSHWEHLEELARTAHEHDVVLRLYFWSYKWDYRDGAYNGTDMLWPDPSDNGGEVADGLTRRDLHELAIERVVEATWEYPNVVYNFMWEYNTQRSSDRNGAFHRWWVERLREAGRQIDPGISHLVSIEEGRPLPGDSTAQFGGASDPDFIAEEDGNGFWYSCDAGREKLLEYNVPLVFIASDYPFADNDFSGWDDVPFCSRERSNGSVTDYRIKPGDVRDMLMGGFHPAEAWTTARSDTLHYYLQARWYMENAGVLDTTLDDELREVPSYRPSERPQLINPEGFTNGRDGDEYAALYRHPDGLPPAQAEVWIDVNGDGRFSPDPMAGERFEMEAQGGDHRAGDYQSGVLFTLKGTGDRNYVFRFADENWNPPQARGLVPGKVEGISYDHWGD